MTQPTNHPSPWPDSDAEAAWNSGQNPVSAAPTPNSAAPGWPGTASQRATWPAPSGTPYPGAGVWSAPQHAAPVAPRTPNRRRRNILIATSAALVLIAGLAFALTRSGDGTPGASTGALTVQWAVMGTEGTQSGTGLSGSWTTSSTVADGRADGVIAYWLGKVAAPKSQQAWSFQTPAGGHGCAMSDAASGGIGVFAYGSDKNTCDQLVALNVTTGKQVWPAAISLKDTSRFPTRVSDPHLAVSGDTLAAAGPQSTIEVFDLATGQRRWATPVDTNIADDVCSVSDIAAVSDTVYGLFDCEGLHGTYVKLAGYDAHSGSVVWKGDVSQIPIDDQYSLALWGQDAAGALLLVDSRSKDLLVYAGHATSPARISLASYDYNAFDTAGQTQRRPHGFAVYGHTLYIQDAPVAQGIANAITALDLSTGKQLWSQDLGGGTASTIIKADAEGVHCVLEVPGQGTYQLAVYAAGTGKLSYGASTRDGRFTFTADSSIYLVGNYLVNLPASVLANTPALIVLSGASH